MSNHIHSFLGEKHMPSPIWGNSFSIQKISLGSKIDVVNCHRVLVSMRPEISGIDFFNIVKNAEGKLPMYPQKTGVHFRITQHFWEQIFDVVNPPRGTFSMYPTFLGTGFRCSQPFQGNIFDVPKIFGNIFSM